MRDVKDASKTIAAKNHNPDYFVPISKLCNMETAGRIPSIFCLSSLSQIYKTPVKKLLAFYGIR